MKMKPEPPFHKILPLLNRAARLGSGDGVKKDILGSRDLYRDAANLGSPHAYYELGMSFLYDDPRCINDGFTWMRKAAKMNIIDAQEFLGDVYLFGYFGKKKNRRSAKNWYRRAVESGSTKAKAALLEIEQ